MNLLKRLKKLLGKVETAVTNDEGLIDYKNAHKNEYYPVFEEAVCELQGVNMGKLDDKTRLAFGINLYNLMIKNLFMKVGIGSLTLARGAFFSDVKFNVGGDILSFNDLENGVLRGNAIQWDWRIWEDRALLLHLLVLILSRCSSLEAKRVVTQQQMTIARSEISLVVFWLSQLYFFAKKGAKVLGKQCCEQAGVSH